MLCVKEYVCICLLGSKVCKCRRIGLNMFVWCWLFRVKVLKVWLLFGLEYLISITWYHIGLPVYEMMLLCWDISLRASPPSCHQFLINDLFCMHFATLILIISSCLFYTPKLLCCTFSPQRHCQLQQRFLAFYW